MPSILKTIPNERGFKVHYRTSRSSNLVLQGFNENFNLGIIYIRHYEDIQRED
jgi:hypothetical protein